MDLILHTDLSGLLGLCTFRPGDSRDVENMFVVYQVTRGFTGVGVGVGVVLPKAISKHMWTIYGKPHRFGGPAKESFRVSPSGQVYRSRYDWYIYSYSHRAGGPASEGFDIAPNGRIYCTDSYWYLNGVPHRLIDPAITWTILMHDGQYDREYHWYYHGDEHERGEKMPRVSCCCIA